MYCKFAVAIQTSNKSHVIPIWGGGGGEGARRGKIVLAGPGDE